MLVFIKVSSRFTGFETAFVMRRLEVRFLSPAPVFSSKLAESIFALKSARGLYVGFWTLLEAVNRSGFDSLIVGMIT